MMKIYAKQFDPAYQSTELWDGDALYGEIVVRGNKHYDDHTNPTFDRIIEILDKGELADILDEIMKNGLFKDTKRVIPEYLPPEESEYTESNIIYLNAYIREYSAVSITGKNEIICSILTIVTGKNWDYRAIHGGSQSEWNYVYYPVNEWDESALRDFETEYFNTGTEWIIHEGTTEPENPNEIDGYHIYCTAYGIEAIREDIAAIAGVSPSDVVLYEFDGYDKTPRFKRR